MSKQPLDIGTIKLKPLQRFMRVAASEGDEVPVGIVDEETRTVTFSFSSEAPVDTWYGTEVLSHQAGSARMDRINSGGPLLYNHDADDLLGVVERAWIGADKRGYLSPFMQPVTAGYKYFGQTSFWIDANAATPTYNASFFTTLKTQFDSATGRKKAPNVNDVMGDAGGYIVWNGSAWVAITSATFGGFAFSYAKYRATWGIPAPSIVHILLGTNDFYSATEATFSATYANYKAQYDQVIASIQADTPAAKIIIGIPVSSGRQGDFGTGATEKVKRAMWLLAKQLNADYGGREASGIYLLDYHSVVDRFYGFDMTTEPPFSDYTGSSAGLYKADTTHLGVDGFKQMGNAYMGMLQFLR